MLNAKVEVELSGFWTGIAQLRTLRSANILTSDEHTQKLTAHVRCGSRGTYK